MKTLGIVVINKHPHKHSVKKLQTVPADPQHQAASRPHPVQSNSQQQPRDLVPLAEPDSVLRVVRKPDIPPETERHTTDLAYGVFFDASDIALEKWRRSRRHGANRALKHPRPTQHQCDMTLSGRPSQIRINGVLKPAAQVTREDLLTEYADVFAPRASPMEGEDFTIVITDDAVPSKVYEPRTALFELQGKLKDEFDLLVREDEMEPVTHATEWTAPIVIAPKKGTDYRKLNCYVVREQFQSPAVIDGVQQINPEETTVHQIGRPQELVPTTSIRRRT